MGDFARKVRFNQIAGPSQRKFETGVWVTMAKDDTGDDVDTSLALAGLFFHDLLSYLRAQIKLGACDLQSSTIVRATVALANANMIVLLAEIEAARKPATKDIFVNRILQSKVAVRSNLFSADELLTGVGDGLKFVLRDMHKRPTLADHRGDPHLQDEDLGFLNAELNHAVLYQCAVELWQDCAAHRYRLQEHVEGVVLVSGDLTWEDARAVSLYRRTNLALQDTQSFGELWRYRFKRAERRKFSGMKFAVRAYGADSITRIDIGDLDAPDDVTWVATGAKLLLMHGYYKNLMNEPLPKASGRTLSEVIDAWRFLQSLALYLHAEGSRRVEFSSPSLLLTAAPKIRTTVLSAALGRAIGVDGHVATELLNFLTFTGGDEQEVWSQPLASINQDEVCLVLPCIHSIHLLRVVERWMRQGGIELDRRGPQFESFCIEGLKQHIADSKLASRAVVLDRALTFRGRDRSEEIDIVMVVDETVLLIEAKCILWPDECLQYANYRDTVDSAVVQVKRKFDAVRADYESFAKQVAAMGYTAPTNPTVLCCVLTNSAICAGFPIDGVPVVDLAILSAYFGNSHIKFEARRQGESSFRKEVRFYESLDDAGGNLEGYLMGPPQLEEAKGSVTYREVAFPIESDEFGKLLHRVAQVEIDEREVLKRYGLIGDEWEQGASQPATQT